jgi:hypothetical protein
VSGYFKFQDTSIMKRLLWYICCCWTISLIGAVASEAGVVDTAVSKQSNTSNSAQISRLSDKDWPNSLALSSEPMGSFISQVPPSPSAPPAPEVPPAPPAPAPTDPSAPAAPAAPSGSETQDLQNQLNNIKQPTDSKFEGYQPRISPGFSISNPTGFGADNNLFFVSGSFQSRTRQTRTADGELGIGIGLGNAIDSVGFELAYTLNSFGNSAGFGSGGFSAKIHKRFGEDTAAAIGWNQFLNISYANTGGLNQGTDFPRNSYYATASKIFRVQDDINQPFSRVAVTAGVGSGQFLPESTIQAAAIAQNTISPSVSGLNVFGSVGVRVARPVSAIVEWTGQDLAAGLSIAPFDQFPLVITPAVRDITGAGDGARFILGAGVAINF